MITTYIYLLIGLGANYLFSIFIARNLGAENFGTYNLALTIFNITTLMCTASLDQGLVHLAHQRTALSEKKPNALLSTALILGAASALLGVVALLCISVFSDNFQLAKTVALFSPSVLFFVISTLLVARMQAKHIVGERLFIKYIIEPAIRVASGAVLFYAGLKLEAPTLAMLIGLAAITIVLWKKNLSGALVFALDRATATQLFAFCLPLVASSIFTVAASRADILIMGWLLPAKSIALYAAALQTSAILAIILQAAETVSTSRFSAHIGSGNTPALIEEYKKSTRLSLLAGIPLFILFTCNAPIIMSWFGPEFVQGATAFIILSVAQLISLATGPANPILIMGGKTRVVMLNEIGYGVMIVVAIYFGCHSFGFVGAAIGVAAANILLRIVRLVCVHRYFYCHPHSSYSWKLLAGAITPLLFFVVFRDRVHLLGLILYPLLSVFTIIALGLHENDKRTIGAIFEKGRSGWPKY